MLLQVSELHSLKPFRLLHSEPKDRGNPSCHKQTGTRRAKETDVNKGVRMGAISLIYYLSTSQEASTQGPITNRVRCKTMKCIPCVCVCV